MKADQPGPRRQQGFTLLELLIAITLLGLIATMAFSGFRLGTRAWEVADERDHEVYRRVGLAGPVGRADGSTDSGPHRPRACAKALAHARDRAPGSGRDLNALDPFMDAVGACAHRDIGIGGSPAYSG